MYITPLRINYFIIEVHTAMYLNFDDSLYNLHNAFNYAVIQFRIILYCNITVTFWLRPTLTTLLKA